MPSIKDFKTIIKPIITEKSSLGAEFNQVTFQVNKTSNKKEIKTITDKDHKCKGCHARSKDDKGQLCWFDPEMMNFNKVSD